VTAQTSRHLAREAEHTRNRLARNLDELDDRLTPGNLIDEVLSYARGGSGTFLRATSRAAQQNPVPSMLISSGVLMLLSERFGIAHSGQASRSSSSTSQTVRTAAKTGSGYVSDAAQRAGEAAGDLRDRATDAATRAGQTAAEYATDAAERIGETLSETGAQTSDAFNVLRDRFMKLAHDQPLVLGAIGLAAGAALAAVLPATSAENKVMGDASDKVKETAADAAAEAYEGVKDAAGRVVEKAAQAAKDTGLAEEVSDSARTLSEKASAAISSRPQDEKSHSARRG